MVEKDDIKQSDEIRYIVFRKNGDIDKINGGKSSPGQPPHNPGDGVAKPGFQGKVHSLLYTPMLAETWQVFVTEL